MSGSKSATMLGLGGTHGAGWTVNGKLLTNNDVAGAPLHTHLGRRFSSAKDPRYQSAPSFSFGRKSDSQLNTLACNSPIFCKTGTHRAPQGELLLGSRDRRRDDKVFEKLKAKGSQWKAGTPGPGTYRTMRTIGSHVENIKTEVNVSAIQFGDRGPTYRVGCGAARGRIYNTLGGSGHDREPEAGEKYPRYPTPRNIVPGPGRYHQDSDLAPSAFSDFMRPQGRPCA